MWKVHAAEGDRRLHSPGRGGNPVEWIVHHTAGVNHDPDPAATVRAIFAYHAVVQGWGDIGYNFLVDADGRIYEGRHSGAPGDPPDAPDPTPGEDGLQMQS